MARRYFYVTYQCSLRGSNPTLPNHFPRSLFRYTNYFLRGIPVFSTSPPPLFGEQFAPFFKSFQRIFKLNFDLKLLFFSQFSTISSTRHLLKCSASSCDQAFNPSFLFSTLLDTFSTLFQLILKWFREDSQLYFFRDFQPFHINFTSQTGSSSS